MICLRAATLSLVIVLWASAVAQQDGGRLDRVLDPPRRPPDARLGEPFHLNRPSPFTPAYRTADEWRARAAALRQQVQVAVGLWPMPERVPFVVEAQAPRADGRAIAPVIHGRIERDGYTIEKVFFASAPGHYVSGNLYRPRGATGRRPAVLSPHGHWEDGRLLERSERDARKKVAAGGERTLDGARYPLQARLAGLAQLGVVAFMFDMVGYADSAPIVHDEGFTDAAAELRLQSVMGLQTWNALRALDFLASLPDVDPARIAVTGESGGGTQTFLLAAIDDRPAAAFPAVMVSGAMQGGCVCENAPLLRVGTNNIELAALFAPKPLGLAGANDWTRDILTLGLPELQSIYRLFGAEDRVMARHFPYEHNFNQASRELMYDWFNTHLRLGHATPVVEPRFVPAKPSELQVYDAAHPRPADAADAATLRRTLTRASDAQIVALAEHPAEYRTTIGAALRAMTHEPTLDTIVASPLPGTFRSLPGDGFDAHLALLTRQNSSGSSTATGTSGDAVPTVGLVPKGYKGGPLVVWTHPAGKSSVFEADGRTPVPAARELLQRGVAILAPDVFLTGEYHVPGERATTLPRVKKEERYSAFNHGYNRTVLAQRTHDLVTALAFAKTTLQPSAMHLVAFDGAGVWALLARALTGDAVSRASIDLGGFDFDRVKTATDPLMLPGALKYGGVHAFASLCTSGETEIYNVPPVRLRTPATPSVTLRAGRAKAETMVRWLIADPAATR